MAYSNQQLIAAQERWPGRRRGHVLSSVGLGEQPCSLARARGSSASCRAAIPHAKAVRNWPSASLVKLATLSTASHYFTAFLRCLLAVGLKRLGHAARGVQRCVHENNGKSSATQRCYRSSPWFSIDVGTSISESLDFILKWLATKWWMFLATKSLV
jgi:hypothetical protein